jgi:hypothetical protein
MAQQTDHIDNTNKMVTAVEWLIKKYHDFGTLYYEDLTKAKQMEKEQIIDSYIMGSYDMAAKEFNPEKYYKETYNK